MRREKFHRMFKQAVKISLILISVGVVSPLLAKKTVPKPWVKLQTGLEYAEFDSVEKAPVGDSKIRILKVNPKIFSFHLVNASAPTEGHLMSVRQWSKKHGFLAAINASMYQADHFTSISLMRSKGHTNNPSLSKHKTLLAFTAKDKKLPDASLIDRECDNLSIIRKQYLSLVQSIRMISCKGRNVWKPQKEKFSTAAIASDKDGNILFIHVRSPYATHDLINALLKLPLRIKTCMYVEGGHQAQMYIKGPEREYVLLGRYSSDFSGHALAKFGWPVPNVIGIKKID